MNKTEVKLTDTKTKALAMAGAAEDKKALDIVVLDVREVTTLADYFVICSGVTSRQVKAIADEIDFRLSAERVFPHHIEGFPDCHWVLMDYGDIVVHIFDEETREYYDLDGLWGDAPKVTPKATV
jgi:ribosome-associated protein